MFFSYFLHEKGLYSSFFTFGFPIWFCLLELFQGNFLLFFWVEFLLRGTRSICAVEDNTDQNCTVFVNHFKEIKNILERFFSTVLANIILFYGLQSPCAVVIKNRIFEVNGLYVIDPSFFLFHLKVEQFMKRVVIITPDELRWKAQSFV